MLQILNYKYVSPKPNYKKGISNHENCYYNLLKYHFNKDCHSIFLSVFVFFCFFREIGRDSITPMILNPELNLRDSHIFF